MNVSSYINFKNLTGFKESLQEKVWLNSEIQLMTCLNSEKFVLSSNSSLNLSKFLNLRCNNFKDYFLLCIRDRNYTFILFYAEIFFYSLLMNGGSTPDFWRLNLPETKSMNANKKSGKCKVEFKVKGKISK